jgi:hypothetical protein
MTDLSSPNCTGPFLLKSWVTLDASTVLGPPDPADKWQPRLPPGKFKQATRLLVDRLAGGPVRALDVDAAARGAGIEREALKRACMQLGVWAEQREEVWWLVLGHRFRGRRWAF